MLNEMLNQSIIKQPNPRQVRLLTRLVLREGMRLDRLLRLNLTQFGLGFHRGIRPSFVNEVHVLHIMLLLHPFLLLLVCSSFF